MLKELNDLECQAVGISVLHQGTLDWLAPTLLDRVILSSCQLAVVDGVQHLHFEYVFMVSGSILPLQTLQYFNDLAVTFGLR